MKYLYSVTFFLFSALAVFPFSSFAQLSTPNLANYDELRREVRAAFARGEERTFDAVERERVQTYWEVGKLIDEHILLHEERADYGEQVIKRLSADLSISGTELYYMLQFVHAYPILPTLVKLTWSHYRELLAVNESANRNALAERASAENWTIERTRTEIKKLKMAKPQTVSNELNEEPLIPIKGSLDVYRLVNARSGQWKGTPVIDLGFSNYLELPKKYRKKFKAGDIVRSKSGKLELVKNATVAIENVQSGRVNQNSPDSTRAPQPGYTYRAYVLDVTDGDTIWVWIELGLGVSTTQQLRLRGIDTPEIVTRDGQAAKEFVEQELKNISEIIVTTSKSDKYDRYLADIFYTPARDTVSEKISESSRAVFEANASNAKISAGSTRATKRGDETKTGEHYLNNRLLEKKLAVRV